MNGEVTDRFNGITLFGMAIFWQKAIEFFAKFIIHFLTYRVERLLISEFYCLLVLQIEPNMDCWVIGRRAVQLIDGRGLLMVVQVTSYVM